MLTLLVVITSFIPITFLILHLSESIKQRSLWNTPTIILFFIAFCSIIFGCYVYNVGVNENRVVNALFTKYFNGEYSDIPAWRFLTFWGIAMIVSVIGFLVRFLLKAIGKVGGKNPTGKPFI